MQASLDRHFKNLGRPYSILRDRQFQLFGQQLEAKARYLRQKGMGKRKHAANALSEDDEEHLWETGHIGKHSAQALVNANFKNLTEHFGLRGRQEHYSMQVEDFSLITNPDKSVRYVAFKEGPTKTRQGGLRVTHRAAQPKMFATGGERCPVMLFEELLQRRTPDLRTTGPFFLGVIPKPKTDVWFRRRRIGEHKIGNIMKVMSERSGLSAATGKKISNHSSRKTCVQKLKSAGVPRDKIMDVTGHRNIQSLNSYEGDNENQSRELSNIISGIKPNNGKLPLQPSKINQSQQQSLTIKNTFTGTVKKKKRMSRPL